MPSKSLNGDYTLAPKYKLNACYIGKSFSSVTLGIFCYLYDKKRFLLKYNKFHNQVNLRDTCDRVNIYHTFTEIYKKYTNGSKENFIKDWKNIMIVREPIKRFISGFVQICVLKIGLQPLHPYCFGCQDNMECFLHNLYIDIRAAENNFKEPNLFIKYHFYPQTWQCDYPFFKDNYRILHYNDNMTVFYNDYLYELKDSGVQVNDLSFIKRMFYNIKVKHSTFDKKEIKIYKEKVMNSPYILTLLSKIFYYDFKEFNFALPKIYHN